MRHIKILLALIILVMVIFADDVDSKPSEEWVKTIKHGIIGGTNYLFTEDGKLGHGFGHHMDYRISERGYISFSVGYTELYKEITTGSSPAFYRHLDLQTNIFYFGVNYQHFFSAQDNILNPYLNVGLAPFAFDQDNGLTQFFNDGLIKAGLGFEMPINDIFSLTGEGNFNITSGEDFDLESGYDMFADLSLGLSYRMEFPKPVCPCPEPTPEIPEELIQKISELENQINTMAVAPEPEPEPVTEDMLYMIQPQDYLLDLCDQFYGDSTKWKDVYKWNNILSKTNPNLIYPFEEITFKNLKKGTIDPLDYEYYTYTVKPFDTLWSIAKKEYNNPLAWIIIVRDNRDVLGTDANLFQPGLKLKLRTKVFNHE